MEGNIIGVLSLGRDITKEKKEEERILYLSRHDQLTGLYNRGYILEKITEERKFYKERKEKYTVIMGDIDNFKSINDNYGHHCGDEILKKVSDIMKDTIRNTDYLGRWGGEEFLILAPSTDVKGAQILAEKIRKRIEEEKFNFNEWSFEITLTLGIASCSMEKIEDCINKADKALLEGKHKGKNRIIIWGENLDLESGEKSISL